MPKERRAWSILIPLTQRDFIIEHEHGPETITLAKYECLIMPAHQCHRGAPLPATADKPSDALHMYAGPGLQWQHVTSTHSCEGELLVSLQCLLYLLYLLCLLCLLYALYLFCLLTRAGRETCSWTAPATAVATASSTTQIVQPMSATQIVQPMSAQAAMTRAASAAGEYAVGRRRWRHPA